MHSRIFFATLILLSFTFTPSVLFGQKRKTQSTPNLKQQIDMEINNLMKNVQQTKSFEKKMNYLSLVESRIRDIRNKSPQQMDRDEIYLDVLMASLEEIPRNDLFKKDRCDIYRQNILSKYDPSASEKVNNPAVKKTVGLLDQLCGN